MTSVFVLQHVHVIPGGDEDVKMIGVYRSEASARMAVDRLKDQPGFRDLPNIVGSEDEGDEGFHISEYTLDKDSWAEGYVSGG
jgi:hypothetical protein